jgi:hypothetical protein
MQVLVKTGGVSHSTVLPDLECSGMDYFLMNSVGTTLVLLNGQLYLTGNKLLQKEGIYQVSAMVKGLLGSQEGILQAQSVTGENRLEEYFPSSKEAWEV